MLNFFKKSPRKLSEVFEELRLVNPRIRAARTVENYLRSIRRLSEIVGHEPTTEDLTDTNLGRLVDLMRGSGKSAATVNNGAKCLKAIWRFAAARGYVRSIPYLPKLPEPDPNISTWSCEQLARLLEACSQQPGYIGPVYAADWWVTFHLIAWDTAERTSAILAIEWEWVDLEQSTIAIPPGARKGGQKWGRYRLRPETVAQLKKIEMPARKMVFEGLQPRSFWRAYNALLAWAGLPVGRRNGPQRIRRTVATMLEEAGGDASKYLQHSDPRVTTRSYLDQSRLTQKSPVDLLPSIVNGRGLELN